MEVEDGEVEGHKEKEGPRVLVALQLLLGRPCTREQLWRQGTQEGQSPGAQPARAKMSV